MTIPSTRPKNENLITICDKKERHEHNPVGGCYCGLMMGANTNFLKFITIKKPKKKLFHLREDLVFYSGGWQVWKVALVRYVATFYWINLQTEHCSVQVYQIYQHKLKKKIVCGHLLLNKSPTSPYFNLAYVVCTCDGVWS